MCCIFRVNSPRLKRSRVKLELFDCPISSFDCLADTQKSEWNKRLGNWAEVLCLYCIQHLRLWEIFTKYVNCCWWDLTVSWNTNIQALESASINVVGVSYNEEQFTWVLKKNVPEKPDPSQIDNNENVAMVQGKHLHIYWSYSMYLHSINLSENVAK